MNKRVNPYNTLMLVKIGDISGFLDKLNLQTLNQLGIATGSKRYLLRNILTVAEIFRKKFFNGPMFVEAYVQNEISKTKTSLAQNFQNPILSMIQ